MKTGIHPKYVVATVSCACGHTWQTMSTQPVLKTDLCSNCHPFFTGEQRIIDTAGQVERFLRRMGNRTVAPTPVAAVGPKKSKNKANIAPPPQERRPRPAAEEGEAAEAPEAEAETVTNEA